MVDFFDSRIDGYDEHMLNNIESAREFYHFTAECLPRGEKARILDLGCGTGLELGEYLSLNPTASAVGIDLAPGMLAELQRKLGEFDITLILGSYFDLPLGKSEYDAAVSVESLHHFTKAEKIPLYRKLHDALKDGGYFILTDYFADSDESERKFREELICLKAEEGILDGDFYHYDTPLTVAHECEALYEAGFARVQVLNSWGATHTLKAIK